MKRTFRNVFFLFLAIILSLPSCGMLKRREVVVRTEVVYRDSLVWKDTTVYVDVPVYRIKEVSRLYDTLIMEDPFYRAYAYADTSLGVLSGALEGKGVSFPAKVLWRDRIITRDSLVTEVVEKEVKVVERKPPKSYWVFLGGFVALLVLSVRKLLKKVML